MREPLCHFNSIKVQLEHKLLRLQQQAGKFQFHKGTIRTQNKKVEAYEKAISIP